MTESIDRNYWMEIKEKINLSENKDIEAVQEFISMIMEMTRRTIITTSEKVKYPKGFPESIIKNKDPYYQHEWQKEPYQNRFINYILIFVFN